MNSSLTITVHYYALLREERGAESESCETGARTPEMLYAELRRLHGFSLDQDRLWVAVNDEISAWNRTLADGDAVVFIPPVAGG